VSPRKRRFSLALLVLLGVCSIGSAPSVRRAGAGERPVEIRSAVSIVADAPDDPDEAVPDDFADETEPRNILRVASIVRGVRAEPSELPGTATLPLDGRGETAWRGAHGAAEWTWRAAFHQPEHIAVLRATFGAGTTSGVPTEMRWEVLPPHAGACDLGDDAPYETIEGTAESPAPKPGTPTGLTVDAEATRRSWFVDVDACALRFVVDKTNGGAPVIRELAAIEGARDVLRDGTASSDGDMAGFPASNAIDGTYARRWVGAPGAGKWSLVVDLPEPEPIDRVRVVLGFSGAGQPRNGPAQGIGLSYGIAWGPVRYTIEGSEDGKHFSPIASAPTRDDGTIIPLRRRLVRLPKPRTLRAIRLAIVGATGATGAPDGRSMPVVRELQAFRADDARAVIPPPWILSVNANPSIGAHYQRGGEKANDAYYAKFLQQRFQVVMPLLARDDRYARMLGFKGEVLPAAPTQYEGESIETIEGDDEQLEPALLAGSSPPPITILSGSNDWEYASYTEWDTSSGHKRWHWDPLADAWLGGMARLGPAVKGRVAPMLGFCGGMQLLALLEAASSEAPTSPEDDAKTIDAIVRRTDGRPVRGYASPNEFERAWPGEDAPRDVISFDAHDPVFADLTSSSHRTVTREFPESHVDALRPDAFLPGGPLERFTIVASSDFCGAEVTDGGPKDRAFPSPDGKGMCTKIPEVYESTGGRYPIIASQAHTEHPRDFPKAADGDPPEAVADPQLFISGAYEAIVDAYVRNAARD
jgi:hypothetical protein